MAALAFTKISKKVLVFWKGKSADGHAERNVCSSRAVIPKLIWFSIIMLGVEKSTFSTQWKKCQMSVENYQNTVKLHSNTSGQKVDRSCDLGHLFSVKNINYL